MKNKWILIVGATGGIGETITKYLYSQGYNLVLCSKDKEKLKKIEENNFIKERIVKAEIDITNENQIKELFSEIYDKIGKLSGVVHCAGLQEITPISIVKMDKIKEMFEVNVFSVFNILKYVGKKRYIEKNGSIVLLSSLAMFEGAPGNAFYAATKGALDGMLKSVAAEFNGEKRINLISPGVIKSGMGDKYYKSLSSEQIKKLEEGYPLGIGESLDVAYMVEYLLSEKAKWITGQNFILDGGHLSYIK